MIRRALLHWLAATAGFLVLEVATRPAVAFVRRLEDVAAAAEPPAAGDLGAESLAVHLVLTEPRLTLCLCPSCSKTTA